MSVTRLHPIKSNTIYSNDPYKNTGKDQIIELTSDKLEVSRILLGFDIAEISSIISGSVNWKANLILYTAAQNNLPEFYRVEAFNIYDDWNEGTGNFLNSPHTVEASTWKYSNVNTYTEWINSSGETSYNPNSPGGGSWYLTPTKSKDIDKSTDNDLKLEITSLIDELISGNGTGILLKLDTDFESNYNESINIKYFSEDTNTIYKPVLELCTFDYEYTPIDNIIEDLNINISILNSFGTLSVEDTVSFVLGIRKQFPTKTYSTIYSPTNILNVTENCYWQLKDVITGEIVIEGSEDYTAISNTNDKNYFTLNSKNLYRNRYYSFDIFIKVGTNVKKFSPKYIFNVK